MYKIEFSRTAESTYTWLFKHDRKLFDRIKEVLNVLALDPFCGKRLKGALHGKHSYRVGVYRIIYKVIKERVVIQILDIGHRREIYYE